MSAWKVSAERIKLSAHPKADRLKVGRVGLFQVVVNEQGGYQDGDVVVFAPRRALLPADLCGNYVNTKTGESFLVGPEKNRVSHARMRGMLSEGVIIPSEYVKTKLGVESLEHLTIGKDIAADLGIEKHVAPVPLDWVGKVVDLDLDLPFRTHDVQLHHIFGENFKPGEPVLVTEKAHGTQGVYTLLPDGRRFVTSKSFADDRLTMVESYDSNVYWQAARHTEIFEKLASLFPGRYVQIFGEVLPTQKGGYSYGLDYERKTALFYRMLVDVKEIAPVTVLDDPALALLKAMWVPELYRGPYDLEVLKQYATGKETVSGKSLHIREGGVVTPLVPRMSEEGYFLATKLINPDFDGSDEDFS